MTELASSRPDRGAVGALRALGTRLLCVPRTVAWLAPVAWMGLIWVVSGVQVIPAPGRAGRGLVGNLAHAFEFGVLALAFALLSPRERGWVRLARRETLAITLACLAYAIVDELHQSRVSGRDGSALDVVTDLAGAFGALIVARYVGSALATEVGLRRRLLSAGALCVAAAALATVCGQYAAASSWL